MTCVVCPTCGSQCSLGGVGETKYFIPPKDENERIADLERQLAEKQDEQMKMTSAAIAHRACCGTEHAPMEGKLHGYCVVCGVPWPCETASAFLFARKPK